MFKPNRFHHFIVFSITIVSLLSSCGSKKDIVYFQNAKSFETMVDTETYVPKFKVGDIIGINVSTEVPEASIPYNLSALSAQSGAGATTAEAIDYIVDKDGNIEFPVLGSVRVMGLSPVEVKDLIKQKLKDGGHLKNPIVNVRLKSFRVTVLGEVHNPGTYQIPGERVSILEALGLAGDLTLKGQRKNVLIIRDFNGTKVYTRIDLTKKEVMKSPVYYLTQNDVIYVEPNKSAVSESVADSRVSIGLSILSILVTTTFFILR